MPLLFGDHGNASVYFSVWATCARMHDSVPHLSEPEIKP